MVFAPRAIRTLSHKRQSGKVTALPPSYSLPAQWLPSVVAQAATQIVQEMLPILILGDD